MLVNERQKTQASSVTYRRGLCHQGVRHDRPEAPACLIFLLHDLAFFPVATKLTRQVPVLLWAGVGTRPHRLAAEDAARATGSDDGCRFAAELLCLTARQAASEARLVIRLGLDIVRNYHQAIMLLIEA
jgi:hypothetical protein